MCKPDFPSPSGIPRVLLVSSAGETSHRRNLALAMIDPSISRGPSWFSAPLPMQQLLLSATHHWEHTATADQQIQAALDLPDPPMEVLVGAYRYYFYKSSPEMALEMAMSIADRIQRAERWPPDWRQRRPLLQARIDAPAVRLYLSAYAASGLLLARLGRLEEARRLAQQLQQVGAKEFGADRLLAILNPVPDEEEET